MYEDVMLAIEDMYHVAEKVASDDCFNNDEKCFYCKEKANTDSLHYYVTRHCGWKQRQAFFDSAWYENCIEIDALLKEDIDCDDLATRPTWSIKHKHDCTWFEANQIVYGPSEDFDAFGCRHERV